MTHHALRLLTGEITDTEHRQIMEAEYRGLRVQADPTPSARRVIVTTVLALLLVLAFSGLIVLTWAWSLPPQ